ncbi:MAG TPA: MFS transporter [Streptosporangiaceae bacterium]
MPCATGGTFINGETGGRPSGAGSPPERLARATFRDVFAHTEFRALWLAQVLSVAGDQLARVALTLGVFGRTHSPLLAAVTFAASVIPTALGGIALAGLADRLPRRAVMLTCDLIRAALVAAMTLPGVPIAALVGLLFLVTLASAPFTSARAALYPDILAGDRYPVGTAITLTTLQIAQVIGFAAAGVVVAVFGVRTSLLVDALTFVCSAVIIRIWVRARPAARESARQGGAAVLGLRDGLRFVLTDPRLRFPMLLGWLVAFIDVPEGVSAPLAASLGGGAVAVGMILAAGALGSSAGAMSISRLAGPAQRLRWMAPLAVTSCAVLGLFALRPSLPWVLAILAVSGVFSCYLIAANAAFVTAAPPHVRSQAFGVAQAGMSLGQGLAMIAAGAAAEHHSPSVVIAVFGAGGAVAAVAMATTRPRG